MDERSLGLDVGPKRSRAVNVGAETKKRDLAGHLQHWEGKGAQISGDLGRGEPVEFHPGSKR